MRLPLARGPLSEQLFAALAAGRPDSVPRLTVAPDDPLADDDLQVALWACFELHYRGFDEVPDRWEWEPAVIALRREIEDVVLAALRRAVHVPRDTGRLGDRLRGIVDGDDSPSVSRFVQHDADLSHVLEFAQHRSLYQLKEADPHTWAVPRLAGRAKAALVEIQIDEYGGGDARQMHSQLYRDLLDDLGLDDRYGAYVDDVPGITLAVSNVMSLFGLRRDLRGALVGHLAAYEMTSSAPCRRYAQGLRRLGRSDRACAFYDVHVTADALHEQLAAYDLCEGLAADEPELTEDIAFGAAACLHVDGRFAGHVLAAWEAGQTSLREHDVEAAA